MTVASRPITLEEYLAYDDGTERCYELVDGVLVEMPAESDPNLLIATFLLAMFLELIPYRRLRNKSELAVGEGCRYPDLIVLTELGAMALAGKGRSIVTLDMPPPALVIEVVSPGDERSENYQRDYVRKPKEYAVRGIPEFWIVDPARQVVWVLVLEGETYGRSQFHGASTIVSPTFPELNITAGEILEAG
jgi:Uma2 family endonuclease